jgi:hypothetical protein
MVDRTHAVEVDPGAPADICGGGHGKAWDLASNGAVAPSSPADVIKKSLRVDMFQSPENPWCSTTEQNPVPRALYRRLHSAAMSQGTDRNGDATMPARAL